MSPDDSRHGKRAGYLAHRRANETPCDPCQAAHNRASKEYRVKTGDGVRLLRRPVSEALDIFAEAADRGITRHALCQAAGISSSQGTRIFRNTTVKAETVLKLRQALATDLSNGFVDADLTRRRINSLRRQGYSTRLIGEMTGHDFYSGKWRTTKTIRRTLAAAIRDLVEQVGDKTGPSVHAAAMAKGKGWQPLAAWDDPGTLEWRTEPAPIDGKQRGNYAAEELCAEWDHLRRCGVSLEHAAKQLGVRPAAIEKALERVARRVA